MITLDTLASCLTAREVKWIKVSDKAQISNTVKPTEQALERAELLWGKTELTHMFRRLLRERGVSLYDQTLEHHFTGSAIVLDPFKRRILMTYHPWYKLWLQLGGHDDGECDPLAVSAREAQEESGIDDLWVCDWPVRVDPHPSEGCRAVKGNHKNWHYDICYMSVALHTRHVISDESDDLRWFSIDEIAELLKEGKAQQRAFEMAHNSLLLFDGLKKIGKIPGFQVR